MSETWIVKRLLWILRSYVAFVSKDIFTIDTFEYKQNTHDVYIHYHINGKRASQRCERVDDIVSNNKLINSFSRRDVMQIGQLFGRAQERKRNQQLQELNSHKD